MAIQWPATLLSYCRRLTGRESVNEAEDLFQQTLLRALPIVNGQKQHPNTDAYLRRVARHLWIDHVRSAKRREQPMADANDALLHVAAAPSSESVQLSRMDTEAALQVVLNLLTPLERTIFLLQDIYQYTAAETAEALQTTESAVKAALRRSRRKLREWRDQDDFTAISDSPESLKLLTAYTQAFCRHDVAELIRLGRCGQAPRTTTDVTRMAAA